MTAKNRGQATVAARRLYKYGFAICVKICDNVIVWNPVGKAKSRIFVNRLPLESSF